MTTATEHKGLYSALAAAQAEMGRALKDTANPHFKSKYADLASVMSACMGALNKHGIAVLQPTFDEDGNRYVKTILVHGPSGESAECRVPLLLGKQDMQGYGSAVTYARRYGLMGMAGIAPDDDDGNAAVASGPVREAPRAAPTPDQIDMVAARVKTNLQGADTLEQVRDEFKRLGADFRKAPAIIALFTARKAELSDTEAAKEAAQ